MSLEVIVCGANGRMGKDLAKVMALNPDFRSVGAATREIPLKHVVSSLPVRSRPVVIDFSAIDVVIDHARIALEYKLPLLVGVSGVDQMIMGQLRDVSQHIPVMVAANTSVVANWLAILGSKSAQVLDSADIEIAEIHHRHKKDSPSGTAHFLGQEIASARNLSYPQGACFDRHGSGTRKAEEIGIVGLRGGDVAGTHTIYFLDDGETLEITHRVTDRLIFARGALKAAQFLASQTPGLYSMLDMLKMDRFFGENF